MPVPIEQVPRLIFIGLSKKDYVIFNFLIDRMFEGICLWIPFTLESINIGPNRFPTIKEMNTMWGSITAPSILNCRIMDRKKFGELHYYVQTSKDNGTH